MRPAPGCNCPVGGQTFDRDDIAALGALGRHQAGHHRLAVEPDRAGATLALGAAFLDAVHASVLAQGAQQGLAGGAFKRGCLAVEGEGDRGCRLQVAGGRWHVGMLTVICPTCHLPLVSSQQDRPGRPAGALCSCPQLAQGALDQHANHRSTVVGGGAHIVDGMSGLDGQLGSVVHPCVAERPADQAGLRLTGAHDGRRDRAEGDARRSDQIAVEVQHHGDVDQRDRLCPPQPQLDEQAAAP